MPDLMEQSQQLASDNYAGACPEVMEAIQRANSTGHEISYGDDHWTHLVCDRVRDLFEIDCEVFFVFNGTAANSLSLAALCQSYHSVICHNLAHIETDECGGPEFFSNGSKLLLADGENGKINPDSLKSVITKRSDIHFPKPKVLSVTQSTELGTVYKVDELHNITDIAKSHNMKVHMDGARFANAIATLNVSPADITWRAGVDVLCFGGTKNGLPVGEMVIFFNKQLAEDFAYRVKQAGQLCSKMRFISAPWLGLLDNDLWLKNARHANAMAKRLHDGLTEIENISIMSPNEANAVFVTLPQKVSDSLKAKGWMFYNFIGQGGARLMCSWDTKPETIDNFITDAKAATQQLAES